MLTAAESAGVLESSATAAAVRQFGICMQRLASWKDLTRRLELCQLCPQSTQQARFCIEGKLVDYHISIFSCHCIVMAKNRLWQQTDIDDTICSLDL